jgi:hypothetical protein
MGMGKRLIDRFSQDFDRHLSNNITREETFKRAKEDFESACGFTAYSNYQSYRTARANDIRKRRGR